MEEWVTPSRLAEMLGVSRQQIYAWASRRRNNGFPRKHEHKYNVQAVTTWLTKYEPSKGGRPRKDAQT